MTQPDEDECDGHGGLTQHTRRFILRPMRPRLKIRLQALALVSLLGVLTTGVPSHHHGEAGTIPILVDAGHHGHGVKLVELTERLTAGLIAAVFPSRPVVELDVTVPLMAVAVVETHAPAARGQPPPSDLPRAPPVSA